MKKSLISIVFITGIIMTGCSSADSGSTTYAPVEETEEDQKAKEEENEKEFIKTAIESSQVFDTEVSKLKTLLLDMDVNDSGWSVDVHFAIEKIQMTANTYKGSMDFMSDKNFEKYSKTIEYYDKGANEMQDIYSEMYDALETYDKRKIEETSEKLDPAMELINKAIEQLEVERYQ